MSFPFNFDPTQKKLTRFFFFRDYSRQNLMSGFCVMMVIIGWYQGERMRDDQRGWFPGNYTVEIASSHVRARNLRQRYRLLALSGNFIEEQARRDKEESKRKSKKNSVVSLND
jgi:hypothetical protein